MSDVEDVLTAAYSPAAQQLPDYLSYSTYVITQGNTIYTTQSVVYIPQTYYGASIPLDGDWTYGGLTSPTGTTTNNAATETSDGSTSIAVVTTSATLSANTPSSIVVSSASIPVSISESSINTAGSTATSISPVSRTAVRTTTTPFVIPFRSGSSSVPSSRSSSSSSFSTTLRRPFVPPTFTPPIIQLSSSPTPLRTILLASLIPGIFLLLLSCCLCFCCARKRKEKKRKNVWKEKVERYRAGEGGIGGLSGVDAGDDGGRIGEGRNVDVVLARGEDEAREGLMGGQEGEMDQGGKAIEKKRSLPAALLMSMGIRKRTASARSRGRVPSANVWDDSNPSSQPAENGITTPHGTDRTMYTAVSPGRETRDDADLVGEREPLSSTADDDIRPEDQAVMVASPDNRDSHDSVRESNERPRTTSMMSRISSAWRTPSKFLVGGGAGRPAAILTSHHTTDSSKDTTGTGNTEEMARSFSKTPNEADLFFHVPEPPSHSPEASEEAGGGRGGSRAGIRSPNRSPIRAGDITGHEVEGGPGFVLVYPDTVSSGSRDGTVGRTSRIPISATSLAFPSPPNRQGPPTSATEWMTPFDDLPEGATRPDSRTSQNTAFYSIPASSHRGGAPEQAMTTDEGDSKGRSSALSGILASGVEMTGIDEHGRKLTRRVPSSSRRDNAYPSEEADIASSTFGKPHRYDDGSVGSLLTRQPSATFEDSPGIMSDQPTSGMFGSGHEGSSDDHRMSGMSFPGVPIVPEHVYRQAWGGNNDNSINTPITEQDPIGAKIKGKSEVVDVPLSAVGSKRVSFAGQTFDGMVGEFGEIPSGIMGDEKGIPLGTVTETVATGSSRPRSHYASILSTPASNKSDSSTSHSGSSSKELPPLPITSSLAPPESSLAPIKRSFTKSTSGGSRSTEGSAGGGAGSMSGASVYSADTGESERRELERAYSVAALRGRRSIPQLLPTTEALFQLSSPAGLITNQSNMESPAPNTGSSQIVDRSRGYYQVPQEEEELKEDAKDDRGKGWKSRFGF